jgi:hypothetical protein
VQRSPRTGSRRHGCRRAGSEERVTERYVCCAICRRTGSTSPAQVAIVLSRRLPVVCYMARGLMV